MKNATRILVSTFGAYTGLMGIEHGIGEILQGSVDPGSWFFPSWPGSPFFSNLSGEPAISIIPNLLITGILATLLSSAYILVVTLFVERKHANLLLIFLAGLMLLFGAGVFPPLIGLLVGLAAGLIRSTRTHFGSRLSVGSRRFLSGLWPWFFGLGWLAWLGMVPGIPLLKYYFHYDNEGLILMLLAAMFIFPILAGISGLARDSQQ